MIMITYIKETDQTSAGIYMREKKNKQTKKISRRRTTILFR
jgi:DNA-binding LytR/AlgR family response regulator